jgi:hypothetical protein
VVEVGFVFWDAKAFVGVLTPVVWEVNLRICILDTTTFFYDRYERGK